MAVEQMTKEHSSNTELIYLIKRKKGGRDTTGLIYL
jgi:hypothetical protein